ncbi:hypothetical protein HUT03_05310 [Candidatus Liberibacter africanus]|uniref:Phage terminase, large subunit n=1 Tax=Candidatus Liberibacter africanus PTSAPSY TaxID=1277257 RepID=A0A0G3I430_LIBAF|nr:hypothetical protein [Candidatus Liberibacter africanus]AKK20656.1 phage terminase, large subunit [Candidatus Liberibacter africanus PTSAPSY]QTP64331.1 hypothetical protein HUT03_05310 [Candidatus Liberibacter africanus]
MFKEKINEGVDAITSIAIDRNGHGGLICDCLQDNRYYVELVMRQGKADESDLYRNRRTELYFKILRWLENGASLINNPFLIRDLKNLELFTEPKTGKLAIVDKHKNGNESADYSDALYLTFAYHIARKDSSVSMVSRPFKLKPRFSVFKSRSENFVIMMEKEKKIDNLSDIFNVSKSRHCLRLQKKK